MIDVDSKIAVVQGAPSALVQDLFHALVTRWQPSLRLAGVIAENHDLPGRGCAAGYLCSLADGGRYSIFQDLGQGSQACHLAGDGVLAAAAAVRRDIENGCDLVVLSKFGKLEADGGGLRDAFGAAIEAGLPILTSVSPAHIAAWNAFAAPLYRPLPANAESIEAWKRSVIGTRPRGAAHTVGSVLPRDCPAAMTSLHQAWASLQPRLKILEPVPFSSDQWSLLERLRANFNDREAHTHLPLPIARFREDATKTIFEQARQFDDVRTEYVNDAWFAEKFANGTVDAMADYARLYNDDVDAMMGVLVPSARYRKGHYAYGKFTVPAPHGLHTDHSAEDPEAAGEPICIARIETLGTHYVAGDYKAYAPQTQSMFNALRYWIAVPEGEPEHILDELLKRETLKTIPVNHVMLMVAGNGSETTQVTQHIAARPPAGGLHSAFLQRQYRLT